MIRRTPWIHSNFTTRLATNANCIKQISFNTATQYLRQFSRSLSTIQVSKPTFYSCFFLTSAITINANCLANFNCRAFNISNMASTSICPNVKRTFKTLSFDNMVIRSLPMDTEAQNFRRQVKGACFSYVTPEPVENPRVMAYATSAMKLIDITRDELDKKESAEYLSGNKLMTGSVTASHCYCGHQFGVFAGQLGDGAAIYLGEIINNNNERWEIQLKGAGPTPYSRSADGRKVVRSSIREFLCSEAIHHLGIATTRAGSVITSDTKVVRDIFYTGNPILENCAVVLRIAPTFLRFGSFEIFKPEDSRSGMEGPSVGNTDLLRQMLDYTAEMFFHHIWDKHKGDKEKIYTEMYRDIVKRTAQLVAKWQCVGWVHGVLNTDNMSILGLTIDYGPFGFIDAFSPRHVPNTSDDRGRYAYREQPGICKWNCEKLAEAWREVVPLEKTKEILEEVYDKEYTKTYEELMHKKLGLHTIQDTDSQLFEDLFSAMGKTGADFTNTFRSLSRVRLPAMPEFDVSLKNVEDYILSQCRNIEEMKLDNQPVLQNAQLQMLAMMARTDPRMLAMFPGGAELLEQEMKRIKDSEELQGMTDESKSAKDREIWHEWLRKYTDRLKQEYADKTDTDNKVRVEMMNSHNPRVILRNYLAQNAIVAAEQGHYTELRKLLRVLEHPFDETVDCSDLEKEAVYPSEECSTGSCRPWKTYRRIENFALKPPSWTRNIKVSCSS